MSHSVQEAYNYCYTIMKNYSKSFSFAFNQLPLEKRQAVWAIYAFCRQVDDSIDLEQDEGKLLAYKTMITTLFENTKNSAQVDKRVECALIDTFKNYSFEKTPFLALIETVKGDLSFKQPETDESLMAYCYGAAGTVGEMLLPILATKNKKQAKSAAIALGQAMQLTNILRDVGEDFLEGRIYFSKEKMAAFDVNLYTVFHGGENKNYIELWEFYAKKANTLYQKALLDLDLFDEDSRFVIMLAAKVYGEIIEEVRSNHYTLERRIQVGKLKKRKILNEIQKMISF
ncbi:phytoene/squalene synthase family protein [Listeria fleischmannii]|jgi:4,4'-diapophytoene synthase|uniref:Phytoene/squalene synthase family protein n=2 Tax=Listeria fleischmannii TaxID=1069827 RepID=A0A841YAT6_9LIST|nr:phytoene/squalene synthase family protein [Listeria fleischmannii]MBC1397338.1 phytoene/squalene synthase family protein [Listeria fleischmannii]MBC1425707.1 phytoene/squalene synthase family protein [Listeria fleischmannii]